jgi:hypothetical protein
MQSLYLYYATAISPVASFALIDCLFYSGHLAHIYRPPIPLGSYSVAYSASNSAGHSATYRLQLLHTATISLTRLAPVPQQARLAQGCHYRGGPSCASGSATVAGPTGKVNLGPATAALLRTTPATRADAVM